MLNLIWINKFYLESLDLEVHPVDVADDGAVCHRTEAAVPIISASEGLGLFHVYVADVVVERGDLGGGVRAAVAFELLFQCWWWGCGGRRTGL